MTRMRNVPSVSGAAQTLIAACDGDLGDVMYDGTARVGAFVRQHFEFVLGAGFSQRYLAAAHVAGTDILPQLTSQAPRAARDSPWPCSIIWASCYL
ncbi:MAG: hypothetical protein MHM6MM_008924 [Cercozoa sp. M6MM]